MGRDFDKGKIGIFEIFFGYFLSGIENLGKITEGIVLPHPPPRWGFSFSTNIEYIECRQGTTTISDPQLC